MVTKSYDPAPKIVVLVASYLLDNLILSLATIHTFLSVKPSFLTVLQSLNLQ